MLTPRPSSFVNFPLLNRIPTRPLNPERMSSHQFFLFNSPVLLFCYISLPDEVLASETSTFSPSFKDLI